MKCILLFERVFGTNLTICIRHIIHSHLRIGLSIVMQSPETENESETKSCPVKNVYAIETKKKKKK